VIFAGLDVLPDESLDLAQSAQRQNLTEPIAEASGERQRLDVVLASLVVLADESLDLA
jgi:hypothetical protein